ncbi:MAG TPA: glutaredoxin family protein [Casimicrobiaceae bacterium]|nr:glutaredoxin family protein [Casimicrobiaceae bacterium]
MRLTLLTRAYCHLCDEMLAAVRPIADAYAVPIDVVDIDAEPALEAVYGELVPVLFAGSAASGAELCRFRIDRGRVVAALGELRGTVERGRAAG